MKITQPYKDWYIAAYTVPTKPHSARSGKIFAGIGRTEQEAKDNCIKDMRKDFAFIMPEEFKNK
jgi:hypothetical protein